MVQVEVVDQGLPLLVEVAPYSMAAVAEVVEHM
jgi:hypothetical protein